MKKFLYLLLATAMLATFGCTGDTNTNSVGSPNPNPFQPKGTVSGVLVDACTNEPIANADVYIMDKKATTNHVGMFTIKKVPANTAVGSESTAGGDTLLANGLYSHETYNVVIDMTKVNAERAKLLGAKLYPSIAYHTVKVSYTSLGESSDPSEDTTTATNHDTPVDGFVANIKPMVGKLSAGLNIETVNGYNGSPLNGATVQLISLSPFDGINTPNNVTGNLVNTIATGTTGADGKVSFTNVEAKHIFYAKVTWTNPADGHVWTGRAGIGRDDDADTQLEGIPVVWTECDNTTTNFYTVGPNPPVKVFDQQQDNIAPYIQSVTPATLSDIAPSATQQVVFTFSEVLKPTTYLLNTTPESSTIDGIYDDIEVMYEGSKSGNIPYTLSWDSTTAPRVLTVTFATAASSRYSVDMRHVISDDDVMDLNGNLASRADDYLKFPFIETTFTTGGGLAVDAPAITRFGTANPTRIDWTGVTNAVKYRIYIARIIDGVTGSYLNAGTTPNTYYDISTSFRFNVGQEFRQVPGGFTQLNATPGSTVPFNYGETKISYSVYAVTVNSDDTESIASNVVVIDDLTRPLITSAPTSRPNALVQVAGYTESGTATMEFNEVLVKTQVENPANWGFVFPAGSTGITTAFSNIVVTYVSLGNNQYKTVVSLDWAYTVGAAGNKVAGAVNYSLTATDLNGNAPQPF